jgi:hypothetical protein
VRGALTPADGFTNVQTDIAATTCKFDYSKSEAELSAKLDELSKTNSHIRDWKKKD